MIHIAWLSILVCRLKLCHQLCFGAHRALVKLLRQSGIESVVQPQAGGVHVRLVYPADREQAETLLQNFAGDLPYTLENTQ